MPNSLPIYDNIINTINTKEIIITPDVKSTLIDNITNYIRCFNNTLWCTDLHCVYAPNKFNLFS